MSDEKKNPVIERMAERKKNAVDPEQFLHDAGAIKSIDTEEQLAFTEDFEARVRDAVADTTIDDIDEAVMGRLFGVDEDEVTEMDRPHESWKITYQIFNWPSEAALVLDVAIDSVLRDLTDEWDSVPIRQRYRILHSLRSFQDYCFFCEGDITVSEEAVESCCSERLVVELYCESCDERFLEFALEREEKTPAGMSRP